MNWRYIGIFLLNLFLLVGKLHSQEANTVQFSIAQGLPQSQVNNILFDSRGLLWIATSGGGLACFDGQNFKTIDENSGLAGNIVHDIVEGMDGKIYTVSSWGGISIINKNRLEKVIPYPEDIKAVTAIEKDGYGTIWIAGNSLSYLDQDELKVVLVEIANPVVGPANIRAMGDYLFVSANDKVFVVDVVAKKLLYTKSFDFEINVTLPISSKTILIGSSQKGLYIDEDGQLEEIKLSEKTDENLGITDIYKEGENKYWITTHNGVYHIVGDSIVELRNQLGIETFDCTTICFDAQGNAWLGTKGEGVVSIVNTPFSYYNEVKGLNKSDNFPILEDSKGRLWVGNNEEGVFIYDGKTVEQLNTSFGLPDNKVRALCEWNGYVFVGTSKGLCSIDGQNKLRLFPEFEGVYIKTLYKGTNNKLYIGTVSNGIWQMTEDLQLNRLFSESVATVSAIAQKKSGELVIGTSIGCAFQLDDKVVYNYEGLINSYIGNIVLDRNGKIWVGTDREIGRLDGQKFQSFTEKDGLTSGLVYIFYADEKGFLWVGTNKGLDRITLDNQSNIIKIKQYGYAEGFKGIEVNAKGVFENQKGEIYFSTVEGIHKYMPRYDYNFSYNTPVFISDVKLFLEPFDFTSNGGSTNWFNIPNSISLDHSQNHLTFEYFAVDYLNPEGVEYTYMLEGFDKKWSPPTESRYAVYNNLPSGQYVFKVKQAGNDFSQIASIKVYVKNPPPPFYRSIWFLLICLVAFALVIYYFTEYRTSKLKNQQAYLEAKIEERTMEIMESEKEKTVLLQEVHHRVKNNLQIIISLFRLQSHFTDNEEALDLFRNSQNRIRTMSKIHEKLYETKDLSKIEVKNYIIELVQDLVASYDIQNQVQIKHDISNCNIVLDELTPLALIINEIITNSLKYGLKDLENPVISITLIQNEIGMTELTIADNGPGFERDIWDNHESMGIELIKTLTEQLNGKISLSFENGHPHYNLKFKAKI